MNKEQEQDGQEGQEVIDDLISELEDSQHVVDFLEGAIAAHESDESLESDEALMSLVKSMGNVASKIEKVLDQQDKTDS
jgi:hypothetical protein